MSDDAHKRQEDKGGNPGKERQESQDDPKLSIPTPDPDLRQFLEKPYKPKDDD